MSPGLSPQRRSASEYDRAKLRGREIAVKDVLSPHKPQKESLSLKMASLKIDRKYNTRKNSSTDCESTDPTRKGGHRDGILPRKEDKSENFILNNTKTNRFDAFEAMKRRRQLALNRSTSGESEGAYIAPAYSMATATTAASSMQLAHSSESTIKVRCSDRDSNMQDYHEIERIESLGCHSQEEPALYDRALATTVSTLTSSSWTAEEEVKPESYRIVEQERQYTAQSCSPSSVSSSDASSSCVDDVLQEDKCNTAIGLQDRLCGILSVPSENDLYYGSSLYLSEEDDEETYLSWSSSVDQKPPFDVIITRTKTKTDQDLNQIHPQMMLGKTRWDHDLNDNSESVIKDEIEIRTLPSSDSSFTSFFKTASKDESRKSLFVDEDNQVEVNDDDLHRQESLLNDDEDSLFNLSEMRKQTRGYQKKYPLKSFQELPSSSSAVAAAAVNMVSSMTSRNQSDEKGTAAPFSDICCTIERSKTFSTQDDDESIIEESYYEEINEPFTPPKRNEDRVESFLQSVEKLEREKRHRDQDQDTDNAHSHKKSGVAFLKSMLSCGAMEEFSLKW